MVERLTSFRAFVYVRAAGLAPSAAVGLHMKHHYLAYILYVIYIWKQACLWVSNNADVPPRNYSLTCIPFIIVLFFIALNIIVQFCIVQFCTIFENPERHLHLTAERKVFP